MQRHQCDTIRGSVLGIGITGQCCTGQESSDPPHRSPPGTERRSQFLQVATPFLGLIRAISDQLADAAAISFTGSIPGSHLTTARLEIINQIAELQQPPAEQPRERTASGSPHPTAECLVDWPHQ